MLKKGLVKIVICIGLSLLFASCSQPTIDVKSPCVSLDEGPCGPKRSVNDWWMKPKTNT